MRGVVALFQPHTYARSRYLLDGFKTCFRDFDRLFILETYAAREAIADGLTRMMTDTEFRARMARMGELRAGHFTWDKTVELFAQTLEKVAGTTTGLRLAA